MAPLTLTTARFTPQGGMSSLIFTTNLAITLLLLAASIGQAEGQPRLLYAETVRETTSIRLAGPMGQDAQTIYQFQHPDGWDGRFSLSPDGTRIAFNRVSEATASRILKAGLFVLDLSTKSARELDGNIFLYATPVWDQNGQSITYETVETDDRGKETTTVRSVDSVDGTKAVLFTDDATLILPIGFASTGRMLYYRASPGSHSLMAYESKTRSRQLSADLTVDRPRDFSLSPDRKRVLFRAQSTQQAGTEAVRYFDIERGQITTVTEQPGELPTPSWSANSQSVSIGGRSSRQRRQEWAASGVQPTQFAGVVGFGEYPAPEGIELPIAQSKDGGYDFVRYHTPTADHYGVFDRANRAWLWLDSQGFIQWIGWTIE
jgi:Tol biopolymer transport system component